MKNHIEEYFDEKNTNEKFHIGKELFKSDDIEVKTDLTLREIALINVLDFNNQILKKHKLKPIWNFFIEGYMKKKLSLERKSRQEFVTSSQTPTDIKGASDLASNISNIVGAKK